MENDKLVVILVNAVLETAKIKKLGEYQLLNSDDHAHLISKAGGTVRDYRPDILHQTMLSLFDSPLAKAGKLQVYIQTHKSILIYVSPHLRVPRTYKRFAGLITQLLHTRKIKAADSNKKLMKVIKNPVTNHLDAGSVKVSLSEEGRLVNIFEFARNGKFVSENPNEPPYKPVFMIGACAHGDPTIGLDYKDECIAISQFGLSAAAVASRVVSAFEDLWGIN